MITQYWELKALFSLALVLIGVGLLSILKAWWDDRRKWRTIHPHYGTTYDAASHADYRPNIYLRRTR